MKDPAFQDSVKYDSALFECKQDVKRHKLQSKGIRPDQRYDMEFILYCLSS